jgi:hypothetical protein
MQHHHSPPNRIKPQIYSIFIYKIAPKSTKNDQTSPPSESSNLSFSAKKDRQYRKVLPIFFVEEKCIMPDSARCRLRQCARACV